MVATAATVTKASFGKMPDGSPADIFTLKNADLDIGITNFGARVVWIKTKDRDGKVGDVVLGYDSVEGYAGERAKTYFGAIVGRYGNRVAKGQFTIDGHTYQIPVNNGPNALHGGPHGFGDKMWTDGEIPDGVEMTLVSPDGDMGFPGTLTVHVRYTLVGSALHIDYRRRRQADGGEPNQPRILQPGGRREGDDPGRGDADQRGPIHAGGRRDDPDGRGAAGGGNAIRLSQADGDRGADRSANDS